MIVAAYLYLRRAYAKWRIDCACEELNDRLLDGSASDQFVGHTLKFIDRLEASL